MRVLPWILVSVIIVLVVIIAAIVVGGTWLNTYIHSDAFKQEVETRAGQTLGGTVQVDKIDISLMQGVNLQGVVLQVDAQHSNGQGALLARVGSVNCAYSWMELFDHTLKLTGITIDQPQIIITRQLTAPAEASPASDTTATAGSASEHPFQFVLGWAKVNDGAVSIRNEDGNSLVELQGLNLYSDTSAYTVTGDVTGSVRMSKVAFASGLQGTDFSTPFTLHEGVFTAKPLAATSFGGSLAGDYQLGSTGPSILNLNAQGVDVSQFTNAMNSQSAAKLSGSLDWQSKWRSAESGELDGEGDAQMSHGKLTGVKMLQDLSGLLKANELAAPDISSAQTHFLVQNRQTQFTGLQIKSTSFSLTGNGVIGFDGGLNANLVLILTHDTMAKMPKEVATAFVQKQDGSGSIQFRVFGTTANPQTDLPSRLLMKTGQNLLNKQLNKFFKKTNPPNPNQPQNPAPNQNQPQGNTLQNLVPGFGH